MKRKRYQIKFGNVVMSHMKGIVAAKLLNLKLLQQLSKLLHKIEVELKPMMMTTRIISN